VSDAEITKVARVSHDMCYCLSVDVRSSAILEKFAHFQMRIVRVIVLVKFKTGRNNSGGSTRIVTRRTEEYRRSVCEELKCDLK
jgi:predicted polyphosphate/ATP-dependent NAD kinase